MARSCNLKVILSVISYRCHDRLCGNPDQKESQILQLASSSFEPRESRIKQSPALVTKWTVEETRSLDLVVGTANILKACS
jgi:hypothetical protein